MIVRFAVAACAVLALGTASAGADTGPTCPATNAPNELVLSGGSGQTAQLGKPFDTPLQVQLANSNGCPLTGNLAGHHVDFTAPDSGASGTFSSTGSREAVVGTNAQGMATAPSFVANAVAGTYTIHASSQYGALDFSLTNTATGVPAELTATGATTQDAAVNEQYAQPLQARVLDANGNPVAGVAVTFAITPGQTGAGAEFLGGGPGAATTNADGVAISPPLVANGVAGAFTATASVAGVAAVIVYRLDNHAAAGSISARRAPAAARVGGTFTRPLRATVRDAHGQPVEGATVTFAIVASTAGAGATFVGGAPQATAVTDAAGNAVSPRLVANTVAGTFTATATTPASAGVAHYRLANAAGAPASIAAGAASGESTTIGTRFPVRLAVTVTDAHGNPVPHALVVFTAPQRGATGHFAKRGRRVRVMTNASGIAIAPPFVAGPRSGGYAVVATVRGTAHRVAFALVNEPRT